jgi:uncharacterized protein (TIGR00725 family)
MMKPKICVSGSAQNNCGPKAFKKAYMVGYHIVKHGGILVTGATIGIPEWATRGAAKAAKEMGIDGVVSIGLSPASSKREHVRKYHLPTRHMDTIIYTGFDYSGRNLLMVRSADAVIEICGRVGTLNEFTIAFEDRKPIGVLLGTGGAVEEIEELLKVAERGHKNVVYGKDPEVLVKQVIRAAKVRDAGIDKIERRNHSRKVKAHAPE